MVNKTLKYLLAVYLPGVFLPIIDYMFSSINPLITWYFMIAWILYAFLILILYYLSERGGKNV